MFFIIFLTLCFKYLILMIRADCNAETVQLIGAGSSFPAIMYQDFGAAYSANRSLDRKIYFFFDRVNSIYGKQRIKMSDPAQDPIIFAGSEAPLSDEEKHRYPELMTFPTVAGAIAIVFNLPKITQINISASTIADIYMGKIRYWNDPIIQSVNPNIMLPPKKISVVARSDSGAGDTLIFTSALSSISQNWADNYGTFVDPKFTNDECCNSTKWPNGVVEFFGNRVTGLVGVVASIPYTLGYAAWANTIGTGVTFAKVINAYGTLVEPSAETVQSAMDYFLTEGVRNETKGLEYSINNAKSKNSYPFASFSYMIVNYTTHPNISQCQMEELVGFVRWLITVPTLNDVCKYGLVPLSTSVKQYILQSVVPKIKCNGMSVYDLFLLSLVHPSSSNYWINMVIVSLVLLITALFICVISFIYYRRKKLLNDNQWMLENNEQHIVLQNNFNESSLHLSKSINICSINSTNFGSYDSVKKSYFIDGKWAKNDDSVFLTKFNMKKGFSWNAKSKTTFNKFLKEIQHQNVLPFLGITVIDTQVYLVNQYTFLKGTLHYVLQKCPYKIDTSIKTNVACDVLEGLKYLHNHNIAHGTINSLNCYIDVAWSVKIAHWEFCPISISENTACPVPLCSKMKKDADIPIESIEELIRLLYLDPDYYSNPDKLPFRSDVYSFGVILIEIFTRNLPYFNEVELALHNYPDIINDKFNSKQFAPPMSITHVPLKIQKVIDQCLLQYTRRIDLNSVHKTMGQISGAKKSVVDILMVSMENYMTELEDKVCERNEELTSVTNRMRELLYDVLPRQIAMKLQYGDPVEPEFYECCTILFSDIVGFTSICARSTPSQVMTFLNDLYTVFDKIVEKYHVYKVYTIGDAYMAASGLPIRNGINHCKCIGQFAIALMKNAKDFQIGHLPDEKLKIRAGINSGPVTAGIIGNKMPQYCVFGDTVNTASLMENTSLPFKIQVSDTSHNLYLTYFPQFSFDLRGSVEIKGKGTMNTYWLLSHEE